MTRDACGTLCEAQSTDGCCFHKGSTCKFKANYGIERSNAGGRAAVFCQVVASPPPTPTCTAGKYVSGTECRSCAYGKYQGSEGYTGTTCHSCAPGKYQNNDATSCGSCDGLQCSPGQFEKDGSCRSCQSGRYQSACGQKSCTRCASGQYQGSTGQTGCIDCAAGQYLRSVGGTSCINCAAGQYQNSAAQTSCKFCGSGEYVAGVGQGDCTACSSGKYQPLSDLQYCRAVLYENNNRGGLSVEVTACNQWVTLDTWWKNKASAVVVEGEGCEMTAADGDGGNQPYDATSPTSQVYATGIYANHGNMLTPHDTINSVYLTCPAEYLPNRASCRDCASGQFQGSQGQTTCAVCPAVWPDTGSWVSAAGSSSCTLECDPGHRAMGEVCNTCAPGWCVARISCLRMVACSCPFTLWNSWRCWHD